MGKARLFLLSILLPFCLILSMSLTLLWQRTNVFFDKHVTQSENLVQRSLDNYKKNALIYAHVISENILVRQAVYLDDVSNLKNIISHRLVSEFNASNISVFDAAGLMLYQVADTVPISDPSGTRVMKEVLDGSTLVSIHRSRESIILETFCPVFHTNLDNMVVGAVCVDYRINNDFARAIKNTCGVDIVLFDNGRLVASSFPETTRIKMVSGVADTGKSGKKILVIVDNTSYDAVCLKFKGKELCALALYVVLDHSVLKNALGKTIKILLVAFLILGGLGAVMAMLIAGEVVQSMNKVIRHARDLSVRHFDKPIEITGKDEFSEVAQAFNLMSRRLKVSFRHIEDQALELEKTKTYLNNVIDSMPLVLIGLNQEGNITFLNKKGRTIHGESVSNSAGSGSVQYKELLKGYDASAQTAVEQVITTLRPARLEMVGFQKDKEQLFHRFTVFPVLAGDDSCAMICIEDTTEQHLMELRLRQSQKMESIGRLAGGIAHDFNNILTSIFGNIHLSRMTVNEPDAVTGYLDKLDIAAQRAAGLIRQILTFSRQTKPQKKEIQLQGVVNEALKLLRSTLPTAIEVKEQLESRSYILADATQMLQVVMNLCTNAYAAMEGTKGLLTVTLKDIKFTDSGIYFPDCPISELYLRLEVIDTGKGMDEKTLEKAFDPYFTTKEIGRGTGLGLTLVQSIVAEHQGILNVRSMPGKGSRFQLFFPIVSPS